MIYRVAIGALMSCGGGHSSTGNQGTVSAEPSPPTEPTAWEYDEPEPRASFSQAKAEETIAAAVETLLAVNGLAPLAAYDELLATADSSCPYYSEYEGSVYWYGGCTTEEGVRFEGYSFFESYDDAALFGDTSSVSGETLNTQGSIHLPTGERFDMGGALHALEGSISDELYAWSTGIRGTFGWSEVVGEETWMDGPLMPTLETTAYLWDFGESGTFRGLNTTAGLTGLGTEWDTAFFSDLTTLDTLFGHWPCPEEPSGTISVRSPDGHWFDVVYDVHQNETDGSWSVEPSACDGCGEAYLHGEPVGRACNDFSPLRAWGDQPW